MTKEEQQILWHKIKKFELDEPTSELNFTDRLARENGWSLEYTIRSIVEYKKFIFLLCVASHPLTPSDQVDQVWHLHLLYTQSYWIDFCQQTLGKPIHHGPTKGGRQEKDKFTNWYEKTRQLYELTFQQVPPDDIWPSSELRFKPTRFQRINLNQYWIIRKLSLFSK